MAILASLSVYALVSIARGPSHHRFLQLAENLITAVDQSVKTGPGVLNIWIGDGSRPRITDRPNFQQKKLAPAKGGADPHP